MRASTAATSAIFEEDHRCGRPWRDLGDLGRQGVHGCYLEFFILFLVVCIGPCRWIGSLFSLHAPPRIHALKR
ncbi:hypothetical protein BRADI_1g49786v3 [Brachypodium distachyon]|uniref:Uncharacterized protein n=1 Tax=Brachypodium distachyon TaxID=15368 RepID=A0A0Q3K588_BRADI|nr:hypothetical protein BRADI_1g49786v3 [Brachypodium distachyon]